MPIIHNNAIKFNNTLVAYKSGIAVQVKKPKKFLKTLFALMVFTTILLMSGCKKENNSNPVDPTTPPIVNSVELTKSQKTMLTVLKTLGLADATVLKITAKDTVFSVKGIKEFSYLDEDESYQYEGKLDTTKTDKDKTVFTVKKTDTKTNKSRWEQHIFSTTPDGKLNQIVNTKVGSAEPDQNTEWKYNRSRTYTEINGELHAYDDDYNRNVEIYKSRGIDSVTETASDGSNPRILSGINITYKK